MKLGLAIAAALGLAVFAFLGLRSVLSDPEGDAIDSATEAIEVIEGEGAELDSRLEEAGYGTDGEEAFEGVQSNLDADPVQLPELDEDAGKATATATGTATLALPSDAGEARRELLLFDGSSEETLPLDVSVDVTEGEDGWQVEDVTIEDPYPRPGEPEPAELEGLSGTAQDVTSGALSLLGPGFYDQPDVYATEAEAEKDEWLDARAQNDSSYPPYLVEVPQSNLITGPVDRALVLAMGCEYNTATAELGRVEPSIALDRPGHLQLAEFRGTVDIRPTSVTCRRGSPPNLPLDAAFALQFGRSRLTADSDWRVTRFAVQIEGGEARDIYNIADITGDGREPVEFVLPGVSASG